ncbi:acyl-CoA thioester hydrolase/BAAT C-terminal domain-containing protein [Actinoplanes sp. CA-030573]|uniref:acyl-CoA thioester hydrolase/BAAT C-terminal domain-containing protein n=1 Tax=Actinoplanes sp. CA-030573 TaxID=3239898 RepID=UPI003D8CAAAA
MVRFHPDRRTGREHDGWGVLTVAGSSGRVDTGRARLFARHGALAESIRWFGGPGQNPGPWEIPLEQFRTRVAALRRECDRVLVAGTSFGAEAALLTGAHTAGVDAVVAFAPSDVVWAGVRPDGTQTSHWTRAGHPLPFVPFVPWTPPDDPPSYRRLYELSRSADPEAVAAAAIPVERIRALIVVAGRDDRVWPSATHAEAIADRRRRHGLPTTVVLDPGAGHRAVLPGEPRVTAGARMARGGSEAADRRLGAAAWDQIRRLMTGAPEPEQ